MCVRGGKQKSHIAQRLTFNHPAFLTRCDICRAFPSETHFLSVVHPKVLSGNEKGKDRTNQRYITDQMTGREMAWSLSMGRGRRVWLKRKRLRAERSNKVSIVDTSEYVPRMETDMVSEDPNWRVIDENASKYLVYT